MAFYGSGARVITNREVSSRRGLECSRVTTEYNTYKNLAEVDIYREFDMFEVKVLVIFFGTAGFSVHRNRR
jgi:hypothetical protein